MDDSLPGTHAWIFFCRSSGQLVYYESYLERRVLLVEDYQTRANWVIDQPFRLHFEGGTHVPDFLMVTVDGPKVIDVRSRAYLNTTRFMADRIAMAEAMNRIGWSYEVRSEPDPQMFANLNWLSGFRRRPPDVELFAPRVIDCLSSGPLSFAQLFHRLGNELFSKPVVFHLLWHRILEVDVYAPLTGETRVDLSKVKRVEA